MGRATQEFLDSLVHVRRRGELTKAPPQAILSSSVEFNGSASSKKLDQMRLALGDRLLRLKGHADLGQGLRFVEQVGQELTIAPPRDPSARPALVAIAWQVPQAQLDQMMRGLANNNECKMPNGHSDI
jgi:hypothetical protein